MAPAEVAVAEVTEGVKGTKEMMLQAEAGLKLFKEVKEVEGDKSAAESWKTSEDAKIKALEAEAEALTGAENKKARQAKSKEVAALKKTDQYIDAELVLKGKPPKHGFFVIAGSEPIAEEAPKKAAGGGYADAITPDAKAEAKPAKKDDKKPKKQESAGISKSERDELEKLKNDIIARKSELKAGGMSGGQINKDAEVVAWVARMNELKEKECPGSTTTAKKDDKKAPKLSGEAQKELETLANEIEEYRQKLVSEFQYSKKDIAVDPDMVDMQARLKKLQGKK
eukprot:TRINITY_DN417_c0_g4_i1.p1 TRINITY_DN417_c0_g4~~TRINITY_DN417_c0_g4_i1.p1  ORF type:complete len:283 (+),score=136.72 TRINITY_DN417_c0_g4_i1:117-965(+)